MKKILRFLLFILLFTSLAFSVMASRQISFDFQLTVDGQDAIQAATGDIFTVTLTQKRSDCAEPYTLLAMQDEIIYDKTFFRLVENSDQTMEGIQTRDLARRDHHRSHYLNFVSLSGGTQWDPEVVIGSFQLEVIGTTGVSRIEHQNCLVSLIKDECVSTCRDLTVTISDRCEAQFDTRGGSAVSAVIVPQGSLLQKPADPVREGYLFVGWYKDIDCMEPWLFAQDNVDQNLHLFAKWEKLAYVQRYTDVLPKDWFFADVDYVTVNGLMSGTGNGFFSPNISTNRAMIVTILWRLEGKPLPSMPSSFQDVANGMWYTEAIAWASANQIVTGYSPERFGPMDQVTREQMAAILFRYAKYKGYDVSVRADLSHFTDAQKVSAWAIEGLSWANETGLINGLPGNILAPQNSAVRCQTAAILHRFCENI